MNTVQHRLDSLGIQLPEPRAPAYSYSAVVVDNGLAWVSGQLPWDGDTSNLIFTGRLGETVNLTEGQACARACIFNALAVLQDALGTLDHIQRVLKVVGYVASGPGFNQQPAVIDSASTILTDIFREDGHHARSAVGVAELPRGAPVEIELIAKTRTQ